MTWPRLSADLAGPRSPDRCQSCGAAAELGAELSRWREHDDLDCPERIVVVLCRPCAKRIIEPHPRLYGELERNEPFPGCMTLCQDCRHRDGVRCSHPFAKANGGEGVKLTIARPYQAHVCRSPRRLSGWVTFWPGPAEACAQREPCWPRLAEAEKEGGAG